MLIKILIEKVVIKMYFFIYLQVIFYNKVYVHL